ARAPRTRRPRRRGTPTRPPRGAPPARTRPAGARRGSRRTGSSPSHAPRARWGGRRERRRATPPSRRPLQGAVAKRPRDGRAAAGRERDGVPALVRPHVGYVVEPLRHGGDGGDAGNREWPSVEVHRGRDALLREWIRGGGLGEAEVKVGRDLLQPEHVRVAP